LELITLYQALQQGWTPPDTVSEEEYARVKALNDPNSPLTAFIGIGCSWGGKWWGGYARSGDRNYARNAKNSLAKRDLTGITFMHLNFMQSSIEVDGALIYCDPPYVGTTGYGQEFDHILFWQRVRDLSERNIVLVSEYQAPEDFVCVAEFATRTDLRTGSGGKEQRLERLFRKPS
jgi:DNA adenine methylase